MDSLNQAIDGRIWYFPEITNYWSTIGSMADSNWYALDFGTPVNLSSVNISFVAGQASLHLPDSLTIEYSAKENKWNRVTINGNRLPLKANTETG